MRVIKLISVCLGICFLLIPNNGLAQSLVSFGTQAVGSKPLNVVAGKSQIINSEMPIARASLANPNVADTVVLSPTQLYVVGKTIGETTLTLWGNNGEIQSTLDVRVTPGLARLKEQLFELLHEPNIEVTANQDYVSLSGTVSNVRSLSKALDLAEAYAPKKVINLLQVGGEQQVMLEVRVAEMSRSLGRRLGFNFAIQEGGSIGISALRRLTTPSGPTTNPVFNLGTAVNALVRLQTGGVTWTTFIDALKEEGAVKILAKPNLMTLSGQEASFLAGGEFPIPVPQAFGVITIDYKKFGVGLTFKPTVLGQNRISMEVSPEVSDLDFSRGINTSGGFTVPAITTRRASTVIELADGQSFTIAGLIQDTVRENISKFPFLGDLPFLGPLFRSSEFQKNETELVIIVTPHFVKPLDMANQTLPTDSFVEPDDYTFYYLGELENKPRLLGDQATQSVGVPTHMTLGKLDGKFGHLSPIGMIP